MSLSALAIATRGFGYGSLQIAARGLLDVAVQSGIGGDETEYVKGVEARGKWLRGEKLPSLYDKPESPDDSLVAESQALASTGSGDVGVAPDQVIVGPVINAAAGIANVAGFKRPTLNQPIIGAEEMDEEVLLLMLMLADD
jgi:hypothetical protein